MSETLHTCPCCEGRHPAESFVGDYCHYCYEAMAIHHMTLPEAREAVKQAYVADFNECLREGKEIMKDILEELKDQ